MAALASREVPVPEHIDTFLLRREMPASDKTALQCVMEADEERHRLEREAEELAHKSDLGKSIKNYNALEVLNPSLFIACDQGSVFCRSAKFWGCKYS